MSNLFMIEINICQNARNKKDLKCCKYYTDFKNTQIELFGYSNSNL